MPSTPRRRRGPGFLAAAGVLTLLVTATATGRTQPGTASSPVTVLGYGRFQAGPLPASGQRPDAGSADGRTFTITGGLSGLYPGRVLPLVLRVTNPLRFAITVTSITTTVANASTKCAANYLSVASFQGKLAVSAGGSAHVPVPAVMLHSAPNACQGVTFPLTFAGTAYRS